MRKFFQDTQKRKEIEISLYDEKEHTTRNTDFFNKRETLFIDGTLDQTYDATISISRGGRTVNFNDINLLKLLIEKESIKSNSVC